VSNSAVMILRCGASSVTKAVLAYADVPEEPLEPELPDVPDDPEVPLLPEEPDVPEDPEVPTTS